VGRAPAGAGAAVGRVRPSRDDGARRRLALRSIFSTGRVRQAPRSKDDRGRGRYRERSGQSGPFPSRMSRPRGGAHMTEHEMGQLWAEHIRHEFVTKDVEATLATMVENASVNHVPVNSGGQGKSELRGFYRDVFIGSWPGDLQMTTTNRVFGRDQLVEEDHLGFTHTNLMGRGLPGVGAANRSVWARC